MIGYKDIIEKISCDINDYYIIEMKDIKLYLRKSMTGSIKEVIWDGKTRSLKRIIKQQFLKIELRSYVNSYNNL